jgi:nucleoside-diphosphate-sugar epimerase
MSTGPFIVVVGADGFLGAGLAEALQARRVVYGPARDSDIPVTQAEAVLRKADVIINAGGFRVRAGCAYPDYQRSHEGATSNIARWVRKGALFVHLSSASVLGKSKDQKLGNQTPPNPRSFPSPAYALAKLEADQFVQRMSAEREFRVIFLRPAAVYSPQGAGMVDTVLKLAKRGIILRLYPLDARHHLCHLNLLVEVARRAIEQGDDLPHLSCLVAADPYTVTNRELEAMILQYLPRKSRSFPVPLPLMSTLLRHSFHSRNPRLDLRTWGEIFGVLHLDTAYDPFETYHLLGIDPSRYSLDKTLKPLIQQALVP